MNEVDNYLAKVPEEQRTILEGIRTLVKELVPEAEEMISYGIPTYKYQGKPLLYYASFAHHMSLYPASDEMIKAIPKLEKYRVSKGTLRFTVDDPIPNPVIKKVILHRLTAIKKK